MISITTVLILVASWRVYQKMGYEGWESIVPFYNEYVLFGELYGNGWRFLLMLIPIYNIYLIFRVSIDLAHAFDRSTGFGVGLAFLPFVFLPILGFGDADYYGDSEDDEWE